MQDESYKNKSTRFSQKDWASTFIVVAFIFIAVIFSLPGWLSDDAFISFRYAKNPAEGNGLVFNIFMLKLPEEDFLS